MDLSDLRAIVKRLIGNRTYITDSELDADINNASVQLASCAYSARRARRTEMMFPEMQATSTITVQERINHYSFPSDAIAVHQLHDLYDTSNNKYRELNKSSWNKFATLDTSRDKDPTTWTQHGRTIYITPWPGSSQAGDTIRVSYYKKPTTLVNNSDVPDIPEAFHRCIAYLAGHDILSELNDEYAEKILTLLVSKISQLQDPDEVGSLRGSFSRTIAGSV